MGAEWFYRFHLEVLARGLLGRVRIAVRKGEQSIFAEPAASFLTSGYAMHK